MAESNRPTDGLLILERYTWERYQELLAIGARAKKEAREAVELAKSLGWRPPT